MGVCEQYPECKPLRLSENPNSSGDVRNLINDATDNPELTTVFEMTRKGQATGWMTRKIWHFSGYYARAGKVCDDGFRSPSTLRTRAKAVTRFLAWRPSALYGTFRCRISTRHNP